MSVPWWTWIVLGLPLLLAELAAAGGFYFIFFAVGALVVGILAAFDSAGSTPIQLALFSGLSLGSLLLFRSRLLAFLEPGGGANEIDSLVGSIGTLSSDLSPGEVGKVELRGSAWSARNTSSVTLNRGARCKVVARRGHQHGRG